MCAFMYCISTCATYCYIKIHVINNNDVPSATMSYGRLMNFKITWISNMLMNLVYFSVYIMCQYCM